MHSSTSTSTLSFRSAILLALGLSASTLVGAGGCADRGGHAVCVDTEADYATCPNPAASDVPDPDAPETYLQEVCFDSSEGCDPCDVEAITGAAIEQAQRSCSIIDLQRVTLACGPDPEAEECCYKVRLEGDLSCGYLGRPLVPGAGQSPRLAALEDGARWLPRAHGFEGLRRPSDRAALGRLREHWLECARYEHASVAAFARVSLQLLALGAPAGLLRGAHQAAGDEVRHAQLCFGLAAAYGGGPASAAGPLRVEGSVVGGMDLESAVREAIFEGALGEGTAAMEALEGARACEDPVVRELLLGIAQDEQRHALLGYQTVQWALLAHPQRAREIVRDCVRELHERHRDGAPAPEPTDGSWARYGLISSSRRAQLRHESWTGVVAPVLASLIGAGLGDELARDAALVGSG